MSYIVGFPGLVVVTDPVAGKVSVVAGLPVADLSPLQTLTQALLTDADVFLAPIVTGASGDQYALPGAVASDDSVLAPTLTALWSLSPALYSDADAIFSSTVALDQLLLPALYADSDTIFAPTAAVGAQTILLSLVSDAETFYAPNLSASRTLQPARVTDAETFFDPNVVAVGAPRTLLPSRVIDAETFYAPTLSFFVRTLLPSKVNDSETVYPAYSIDTAKPPKQQTLRPGRVGDLDTIYAARFPRTPQLFVDLDVIFAPIAIIFYPLTAAFVASDDVFPSPFVAMQAEMALVSDHEAIYRPTFSLLLVPELVVDEEAIPAADVGWQVIAEFTDDVDALYDVEVLAFYPLQPEVWLDEETVDTYPFFLQQLTGGIPVPKPIGLTGSLSQRRQLTGSLDTRRRLTGSISPRRELTGSMKNR